jgi:hypothetical protein
LGWLNPAVDGNSSNVTLADQWTNAVFGNFTGTPFYAGTGGYSSITDALIVGHYGVDVANNRVWAVLDHNSIFAVVPEPSTFAMLLIGSAGLWLVRRKRSV